MERHGTMVAIDLETTRPYKSKTAKFRDLISEGMAGFNYSNISNHEFRHCASPTLM